MRIVCAVITVIALSVSAASATGERAGRYTMSPIEGGGFARLDTQTGQMSVCQRREGDWSCREMTDPGGGLASELDRLRADNQRLRGEIKQMEDILLGQKRDGSAPSGRTMGEFRLPSEQDVDAAMDYAQRMLRKFRDKMREIEKDAQGLRL